MVVLEEHTVTYGTTDVKEIFYHAAGPADGPLLIFIHGWPAIGKTWKKQLEAFALLGFRCIAPDMPGMSTSLKDKTQDILMHMSKRVRSINSKESRHGLCTRGYQSCHARSLAPRGPGESGVDW